MRNGDWHSVYRYMEEDERREGGTRDVYEVANPRKFDYYNPTLDAQGIVDWYLKLESNFKLKS